MQEKCKKKYLIAGAAGTIGYALTIGLANYGHKIIAIDKDSRKLETMLDNVEDKIKSLIKVKQLDLLEETKVERFFLLEEYLELDGIVNSLYPRNKSYGVGLNEVSLRSFQENVAQHLGVFFCLSKYGCRSLDHEKGGSLINIASIYGKTAPRFEIYKNTDMTMPVEYAAIKAGIINMSKYFAKFYMKSKVRVNCISPGGVKNGQLENFVSNYEKFTGPNGLLNKETLVPFVNFLLSDGSLYINGQNIVIDDGFSI